MGISIRKGKGVKGVNKNWRAMNQSVYLFMFRVEGDDEDTANGNIRIILTITLIIYGRYRQV